MERPASRLYHQPARRVIDGNGQRLNGIAVQQVAVCRDKVGERLDEGGPRVVDAHGWTGFLLQRYFVFGTDDLGVLHRYRHQHLYMRLTIYKSGGTGDQYFVMNGGLNFGRIFSMTEQYETRDRDCRYIKKAVR